MSSVPAVSIDQLLDAVTSQIATNLLAPASGTTAQKPLRFVQRYMGERFSDDEFGWRGGAGRTPGVFVAFAGDRPFRGTIGRRRSRAEATVMAICVSDSHRSKDDRKVLFGVLEAVRRLVGGRKLGLAVTPLAYAGISIAAETETVFAYAVRFLTRLSIDYTNYSGSDLMLEADGSLVYPPADGPVAPRAPSIAVVGTVGTAHYAYDVQALYAGGASSDWSPWTAIDTAPNVLGGGNALTVSWPAVAGASGYRLRRRWAPSGLGVIYTGPLTSFTDDGTQPGDGNTTPERGLNYDGDF